MVVSLSKLFKDFNSMYKSEKIASLIIKFDTNDPAVTKVVKIILMKPKTHGQQKAEFVFYNFIWNTSKNLLVQNY